VNATTVSNAVAKQDSDDTPRAMVKKYAPSFGNVLPEFIKQDMFVSLANAALQRSADLRCAAAADPASFIHALMDCAFLGHLPGKGYALTARGVKDGKPRGRDAKPTVVGIEEYTGKIERMYRAGAVRSIKADTVRQGDVFRWQPTTMSVPEHSYDALAGYAERGPLRGVYAYAEMVDGGTSQVVVMNRDKVMQHKAKAATPFIWDEWEDEQWLKTALRRLEKFVPTSSEYLKQRIRAEAERDKVTAELPPPPVDYSAGGTEAIEGDLVPNLPAPTADDTWPDEPTHAGGA
jgi:recombination protein RecT